MTNNGGFWNGDFTFYGSPYGVRHTPTYIYVDQESGVAFQMAGDMPDFDGARARDNVAEDGKVILDAEVQFELQPDGSQKEVWYVP